MFSKEELMSKNVIELADIARSLNINIEAVESPEDAVSLIMQAEAQSATEEPVKRTRKRTVKKKTEEKETTEKAEAAEELPLFPKHRGRKSKKELEYLAQMAAEEEASKANNEQPMSEDEPTNAAEETAMAAEETANVAEEPVNTEEAPADVAAEATENAGEEATENAGEEAATDEVADEEANADDIPEATYNNEEPNEDDNSGNLIAQLQEKMNSHNDSEGNGNYAPETEEYVDEIWDGDPGDGSDFIIIEDLPIEDNSATMSLDIFDNPINHTIETSMQPVQPAEKEEDYDFKDIVRTIGLMEIMSEGYGFLRSSDYNYLSSPDDVYINMQQIRKLGLKTGDVVECFVCPPSNGDKYFTLQDVISINGRDPMDIRDRVPFEHLTPLFPDEKFQLCGDPRTTNISTRIVDLFSPIGKGQRALIVAQPKTGKTILMKDIANAIAASHPEAYLMMLLIDERPEEVTDMARTVNAEVIASTFDEPADRHVKIAGLVLEKAKRMVECGHDVVIFLDSITRLARAYNTVAPASGKVLTGGVDANALQKPKRFFGAARNIEGGGSLTIIATALIDTGSKMDEVIFEEFKGTGNMELQLERALANKRIFPAVNLIQSSTRRDDLLQDRTTLNRMWIVRKFISDMNPIEAMTEVTDRMKGTRTNEEFLIKIND